MRAQATASLKRLDDGLNDSSAELYRRRMREELDRALQTNRQPWNNAVWRSMPASLRGVKPVTKEPWISDQQIFDCDHFSVLFDRVPKKVAGEDRVGALKPQLKHRLVLKS